VVLTQPSYQGIYSSQEELTNFVDLCHKNKILVIVDEAHGSHLKFLPNPAG
jgi:1,4-alpha-glucan branching enzyme